MEPVRFRGLNRSSREPARPMGSSSVIQFTTIQSFFKPYISRAPILLVYRLLQMPEEDLLEIKFRLLDGSDIGPFRYSPASTVAMLKERIVAEWPKDKKGAPKSAIDIKLINAGKILENNKTVGQCRTPFGELPKGVITMHAVVQMSLTKAKTEKKIDEAPKNSGCTCTIL
ncbi:hypothetical protein QVD17_36554 [Tagetes erecta]|uniref:Ubiquitin-like domain-containing protein n=1 Tax=Tagetes erecta TaxID=13708 RepID=A0AAD8JWL6_TARER|nr:hypothetical protein QVD17_36554 [Tagetes erecta]